MSSIWNKEIIASIIALLTAIANIITMVINSRKLEKFKKALDIKSLRLSRLWDLRKELSTVKTDGDEYSILTGQGGEQFEGDASAYITSIILMYEKMMSLYLENKSFFSRLSQKRIDDHWDFYCRNKEGQARLYIDNAPQDLKKALGKELVLSADDGIVLIVNQVHEQIRYLETDLGVN